MSQIKLTDNEGYTDLYSTCFQCKETFTESQLYVCEICDHLYCENCMGLEEFDAQLCETCEDEESIHIRDG